MDYFRHPTGMVHLPAPATARDAHSKPLEYTSGHFHHPTGIVHLPAPATAWDVPSKPAMKLLILAIRSFLFNF